MTQPLTNKVLLLGVDGLDPRLTSKFLKEGKLPHIKEFVDRGAQKEDLKLICKWAASALPCDLAHMCQKPCFEVC